MLKLMAVLRTLFLIFIGIYSVRTLPWGWSMTFDEEFARCTATRALALRAAWISIGWIAFETAVGWWMATRRPKLPLSVKEGSGEPPFAPPPAGP
jgi:hypothetical protein